MVSKKILGVAIATAFASQGAFAAFAEQHLSGANTKYLIAKEALGTATAGYYTLTSTVGFDVPAGVGVSQSNQLFVRIDLTNAKFVNQVASGDLTVTGTGGLATVAVVQGGALDSQSVVLSVTAPAAGIDQADVLNLAITSLKVSSTAGAIISYKGFESASTAIANGTTGLLATQVTLTDAYSVASVVDTAFATAADQIAEVETAFKKFYAAPGGSASAVLDATFGKATVALKTAPANTAYAKLNGAAPVLADVLTDTTSAFTITGNFNVGTWSLESVAACDGSGTTLLLAGLLNTAKTVATTTLDVANSQYLCVDVNGTAVIPEVSAFTAAVTPASVNAANPVSAMSGSLGKITRNGTSIQVPYLTTYADYTQRLVLVNRGATAAAYNVTFTPESGVAADVTGGTKVSGSIPAASTLIIPVRQDAAVTDGLISAIAGGKTRTAATVSIVAPTGDIDAATTTVNSSDKSTDTVKLK